MEVIPIYDYYRWSGQFLDQWKLVYIRDDGIYEVYLHQSLLEDNGEADELYEMINANDDRMRLNILKQSIHSAVDGAITYIKVGWRYFHIEADVLETEE